MQENQHELHDQQDEISLIDLIQILWKRRVLIIGGTLLVTVAAAIISFLLPKVYEVSTILEPGKTPQDTYTITPPMIREFVLGDIYKNTIRNKLNLSNEDYPKIKVIIPKESSIVKLTIESRYPDLSVQVLNLINGYLSEETENRIKKQIDSIKNRIIQAEIQKKEIMENITVARNKINENPNNKILYSDLRSELREVNNRIDELSFLSDRISNLKIIKPVTISEKPVRPKKALIVALTFMTSLMGMVFVSFVLDYFKRAKAS